MFTFAARRYNANRNRLSLHKSIFFVSLVLFRIRNYLVEKKTSSFQKMFEWKHTGGRWNICPVVNILFEAVKVQQFVESKHQSDRTKDPEIDIVVKWNGRQSLLLWTEYWNCAKEWTFYQLYQLS